MNIKDFIIPLSFAFLITWGTQYFFFSRQTPETAAQVQSGQSFEAPETALELKPLNREIDFLDAKRPAPAVMTVVETDGATLEFSTDAASLERISYKRMVGGKSQIITTVFPPNETEREQRCFLVALDSASPYFYTLVENKRLDGSTTLIYKAAFKGGEIEKTFVIYHDSYRIDMKLALIQPTGAASVTPRLLFVSPFMPDIASTDQVSLLIGDTNNTITKKIASNVGDREGWQAPTLFGAENRYFINAMITDDNQFVQRSYTNKIDSGRTMCILEGPSMIDPASWSMSFYFGPKEEVALAAVDAKLEQTLEYSGLLAPISKFFMYLLKYFYSYFQNYGIAIILLTLLLRLLLYPLTAHAQKSMKKQEEISKKLKYIEQRYKGDSEALNREKAALIKTYGMPGITGGCLPMLMQIPFFFALRNVLMSSIDLYRAPLGLWIHDLSMPDPYYVLPAAIGLSFILNALVAEKSQRMTMIVSGLVISALMANFSAGLALYMFVSTFAGSVQAIFQKKVLRS